MPDRDSKSTYIIICSGEVQLLTTTDPLERLRIVCQCARDMVMYLGTVAKNFTAADAWPISEIMHWFEAEGNTPPKPKNRKEFADKIEELMTAVEGLHDKFSEY